MVGTHALLDSICVVIPVRNEAGAIGGVIADLQAHGLSRVRVVDNGSSDGSAEQAIAAGADVVTEPIPGYGRACWTGLQQLPDGVEWVLFCDGDGSDDLSVLPQFWQTVTLTTPPVDLVLGDRRATVAGRAVMTPVQNFGNGLATRLIQWGWHHRYGDLGPLRLIRRSALDTIGMTDRGFGWTVEMQVRAVELGLQIEEIPVSYRPRQGGRSKISGTIMGSIQAGTIILRTLGWLYVTRRRRSRPCPCPN